MKTTLLISCFALSALLSSFSLAQSDSLILQSTPHWVKAIIEKSELAQKHEILTDFNPFYLEGDFNGDDQDDIAFRVKNKADSTEGVMIINKGKNLVYIIGCGTQTDMGVSLSWAKQWFIYRDKYIANSANKKKVVIKLPGIQLMRSEFNSLVIYWTGKKYKTFVQQS